MQGWTIRTVKLTTISSRIYRESPILFIRCVCYPLRISPIATEYARVVFFHLVEE